MLSRFFKRKFFRSSALGRESESLKDCGGIPGSNLPFRIDHSPYKMTAYFALFFGIPAALPFIVVRFLMLKNIDDEPPSTSQEQITTGGDEGDDNGNGN